VNPCCIRRDLLEKSAVTDLKGNDLYPKREAIVNLFSAGNYLPFSILALRK